MRTGISSPRCPPIQTYYDTSRYLLNRLDVLRSLTAADKGQAREIFLPDGCGAIIDLDRQDVTLGKVVKSVYGGEGTLDSLYGEEAAACRSLGIQWGIPPCSPSWRTATRWRS